MTVNTLINKKPFVQFSIFTLVFFLFFDYVFRFTTFQSQGMVYLMMCFNLISIGWCFINNKHINYPFRNIWTAYLLMHIMSQLLNGNISTTPYWIICIMLLYIPDAVVENFVPRTIFFIGLFFSIGVYIQVIFPGFYYSYIYPYFIGDAADFIESSALLHEYGFSGFSYQTGGAACSIIAGEIMLLAFGKNVLPKHAQKLYYVFIGLMVISVLLTGKRMPSFISIVLCLASMYFSSNSNKRNRILITGIIIIGVLVILNWFISNIDSLSSNIIFRRFADSYLSLSSGEDISSGRSTLRDKAWKLFQDYPVFGVGADNFTKVSTSGTEVHNAYLQVLCEEGILGFFLFIIPLILIFYKSYKLRLKPLTSYGSNLLTASLFLQIYFILYSFTGNTTKGISDFVMYFIGVSMFLYVNGNLRCPEER